MFHATLSDGKQFVADSQKKSILWNSTFGNILAFKDLSFAVNFALDYKQFAIGDPGVKNLVHLFATRFQLMSVPSSLAKTAEIYTAVAEYNRDNHVDNNWIRIITAYDINQENFEQLLDLTDGTNTIFNGTVQQILFESFDSKFPLNFAKVQQAISNLGTRRAKYSIGIRLDIAQCDIVYLSNYQFTLATILSQLPKLSLIVFRIPWKDIYFIRGVEYTVEYLSQVTKKCKFSVTKENPGILVGFEVTWQDRITFGELQNQTALVIFWIKLAELARQENFLIMVDQAFDRNANRNGWWNSNLTEKILNPKENKYFAILHPVYALACNSSSSSVGNKVKAVKYFGNKDTNIQFDTDLVTLSVGSLRENSFIAIMDIIAQRFQKIFISEPNPKSFDFHSIRGVAIRNNICSTYPGSGSKKLNISVGFDFTHIKTFTESEPHTTSPLDTLLFANKISENIVTTIFAHIRNSSFNSSIRISTRNQLLGFKTTLRRHNFELGIIVSAVYLETDRQYFIHFIQYVLPVVDKIYFHNTICKDPKLTRNITDWEEWKTLLEFTFNANARLLEALSKDSKKPGIFLDLWGCYGSHPVFSREQATRFWLKANKMAREASIEMIIGPGAESGYVGEKFGGGYSTPKNTAHSEKSLFATSEAVLVSVMVPIFCIIIAFWGYAWLRQESDTLEIRPVENGENSTDKAPDLSIQIGINDFQLGLYAIFTCNS